MSDFPSRREKLRRALAKQQAEALLVTRFTNVTYLTGFTGDDSYLLVARDKEVLITDFRYQTQLADECPGLELVRAQARASRCRRRSPRSFKAAGVSRAGHRSRLA